MSMTVDSSPPGANAILGSQAAGPSAKTGDFSAALAAEQRAEASLRDQADTLDAIKAKGFSAWVRDTRIEKLKAEIRKKVMAAMGLDEKSLAALNDKVRQSIEKQIEEQVMREMEQAMKEDKDGGKKSPQSAASGGQNLPDGPVCGAKRVPVIAALATPGGESVLG
ncbi:hypothetical protein CU669_16290 [Paramagnetospirillum kuznetsovii]|uniref:Uncharacterized protein n=1 Tax=Paramagnetospirillum kuznetsovii TaxID=2053833 RepID=A0A364NUU6_9PROT|nr:hypothetical protein [Paramagnetospirillum kuznetsovii]RAU20832.1 hypothetical protein CU669_16290 [Paramagnetospirillum kuznetsovii]